MGLVAKLKSLCVAGMRNRTYLQKDDTSGERRREGVTSKIDPITTRVRTGAPSGGPKQCRQTKYGIGRIASLSHFTRKTANVATPVSGKGKKKGRSIKPF